MKRKWMVGLSALLGVVVIGFLAYFFLQTPDVAVKRVTPEDVTRSFTEDAVVASASNVALHPLSAATIDAIGVEAGDDVGAGEVLAELDYRELDYAEQELNAQLSALEGEAVQLGETPGEAELQRSEHAIEQAEASLEKVENRHERMEILHEHGVISDQALEEVEAMLQDAQYHLQAQQDARDVLIESYDPPAGSYQVIEARKEGIRSQINLLNYQRENYYKVSSPIDGVVAEVHQEKGEVAQPQRPLVEVFSEDHFIVESELLTRDIFDVHEGMAVQLTLEKRDEDVDFPGTVIKISPRAQEGISPLGLEEERVEVTIEPDFPAEVSVGPGYGLDAEFVTETQKDKLVVPKTALFTYEGEDALYVEEAETIALRQVSTGLEDQQEVVIEQGLEAGDKVVIDPQVAGVMAGDRVAPQVVNEE